MKKIFICLISIAMGLVSFAQNTKPTIAISTIKATPSLEALVKSENKGNTLNRIIDSLYSQIGSDLNNSGKFTVVARKDFSAILSEQEFANSGNVDLNSQGAAKIGKVAGAKYVALISVDDFQDLNEKAVFKELNRVVQKKTLRMDCTIKLYDSSTGVMISSQSTNITDSYNTELENYVSRDGNPTDLLIGQMAKAISANLVSCTVDAIYPAKVLAVAGNQCTINRGAKNGVMVGNAFNIFALGKEMIDPDTGENYGKQNIHIGTMTIIRVTDRIADGKIVEDRGVAEGQIVEKAN